MNSRKHLIKTNLTKEAILVTKTVNSYHANSRSLKPISDLQIKTSLKQLKMQDIKVKLPANSNLMQMGHRASRKYCFKMILR